jgi:hypothetical protein
VHSLLYNIGLRRVDKLIIGFRMNPKDLKSRLSKKYTTIVFGGINHTQKMMFSKHLCTNTLGMCPTDGTV